MADRLMEDDPQGAPENLISGDTMERRRGPQEMGRRASRRGTASPSRGVPVPHNPESFLPVAVPQTGWQAPSAGRCVEWSRQPVRQRTAADAMKRLRFRNGNLHNAEVIGETRSVLSQSKRAGGYPPGILNGGGRVDMDRISELLRMLNPEQEKVVRLYFGLGCQRPHSALEIGHEFGVPFQVIAGLLGAAGRRLARLGLTPLQIREAVRGQAELPHQAGSRSLAESKKKSPCCHRSKRSF